MKKFIKCIYKKIIIKFPPIQLIMAFFLQIILTDFKIYSDVKKKFGPNCIILGTAMRGTGDVYFSGMYLRAWLEKNNTRNYVFLCGGNSEKEAARLFSVFNGRIYMTNTSFVAPSDRICAFLGTTHIDMFWFHAPSQTHSICGIHSGNTFLQGYKEFHMLEWYLRYTMCLPTNTQALSPRFSEEFRELPYRTKKIVLISPYSNGNVKGQIPDAFWNALVRMLIQADCEIFTNCAKGEKALLNTQSLFIPYTQIVPFLNLAYCFIGVRSGLCDIVSSALCKKIIIHTAKSYWWPKGNSLNYSGLVNMGLCQDAVEYDYTDEKTLVSALFQEVFR